LAASPDNASAYFSPEQVQDLPNSARRYFLFAIAPGTPIRTAIEIETVGEIGLGTKDAPAYTPMLARQILRPLIGFVWRPRMGAGLMRITGSDGYIGGEGWTRFWLLACLPVARAGGTVDYARSAAARGIAEGLFWAPAAFLPGHGVEWEPINADTARMLADSRGERFTADLTVAEDGRPLSVVFQRNPERVWRFQPFGGGAIISAPLIIPILPSAGHEAPISVMDACANVGSGLYLRVQNALTAVRRECPLLARKAVVRQW
jgi:hypothetical protein